MYRTGDRARWHGRRQPADPGAHRQPGEDPRLPRGAGRDRGGAAPPRRGLRRRWWCCARTRRATGGWWPTWWAPPSADELREHLRRQPPRVHGPRRRSCVLDALPADAHRQARPARRSPRPSTAPADGRAWRRARRWRRGWPGSGRSCWGWTGIGPTQSFFELGGNSLLALRLFTQANRGLDATCRWPPSSRAPRCATWPAPSPSRSAPGPRRPARWCRCSRTGRCRPLFLVHSARPRRDGLRGAGAPPGRRPAGLRRARPGRRPGAPRRAHRRRARGRPARGAAARAVLPGELVVRRDRGVRDGAAAPAGGRDGGLRGADSTRVSPRLLRAGAARERRRRGSTAWPPSGPRATGAPSPSSGRRSKGSPLAEQVRRVAEALRRAGRRARRASTSPGCSTCSRSVRDRQRSHVGLRARAAATAPSPSSAPASSPPTAPSSSPRWTSATAIPWAGTTTPAGWRWWTFPAATSPWPPSRTCACSASACASRSPPRGRGPKPLPPPLRSSAHDAPIAVGVRPGPPPPVAGAGRPDVGGQPGPHRPLRRAGAGRGAAPHRADPAHRRPGARHPRRGGGRAGRAAAATARCWRWAALVACAGGADGVQQRPGPAVARTSTRLRAGGAPRVAAVTLGTPGLAPLEDARAGRPAAGRAGRRAPRRAAADGRSLSHVAATRLRGAGAVAVLLGFHWWAPLVLWRGVAPDQPHVPAGHRERRELRPERRRRARCAAPSTCARWRWRRPPPRRCACSAWAAGWWAATPTPGSTRWGRCGAAAAPTARSPRPPRWPWPSRTPRCSAALAVAAARGALGRRGAAGVRAGRDRHRRPGDDRRLAVAPGAVAGAGRAGGSGARGAAGGAAPRRAADVLAPSTSPASAASSASLAASTARRPASLRQRQRRDRRRRRARGGEAPGGRVAAGACASPTAGREQPTLGRARRWRSPPGSRWPSWARTGRGRAR